MYCVKVSNLQGVKLELIVWRLYCQYYIDPGNGLAKYYIILLNAISTHYI